MGELFLCYLAIVWISCGVFCAKVAYSRGRDGIAWFLAGLVFGIPALLTIGFLPKENSKKDSQKNMKILPEKSVKSVDIPDGICKECGQVLGSNAPSCETCREERQRLLSLK